MFRLVPEGTFVAPVKLTVPGKDAKALVQFTFAHKGKKALRTWIEASADRQDPDFLGEVVLGWQGVESPGGEPVPFTAQAFEQLLDAYPASAREIFDAYNAAYHEAAAKN